MKYLEKKERKKIGHCPMTFRPSVDNSSDTPSPPTGPLPILCWRQKQIRGNPITSRNGERRLAFIFLRENRLREIRKISKDKTWTEKCKS